MGRKTILALGFLIGYFGYLTFCDLKPTVALATVSKTTVVETKEFYDIADVAPINIEGQYQLPDGDFYLDRPIEAKNKEQVYVIGGKNTRILYTGPPTLAAIRFVGVRVGGIGGAGGKGFDLICTKDGVKCGILIASSDVQGGFISTAITVENVHIRHGGYQTAFEKGFSVDSYILDPNLVHGGGNNENHRFIKCTVESCLVAAFHINGYQSYDITFECCDGLDAGRQVNGIQVRNWIYGIWAEKAASVYSIRNNFNRCKYDIYMGWPGAILHVWGHNSEHGRCFLANIVREDDPNSPNYGNVKTAATSGDYYFNIFDVRFDGEPRDKFPVVDLWGRGPFTFKNGYFAGINGITPWFYFSNYSDKINGVWVPLRGTVDLTAINFKQHGGVLANYPLVVTPSNWRVRLFGVEHCNLQATPEWRPVVVNQPLQAQVEN